jgi:hypothetical protein
MTGAVPSGRNILAPADTNAGLLDDRLEPRTSALPAEWTRSPNFSDWWPGDLILIWVDENSRFSRGVRSLQRARFANAAGWTHAAVYAGDGLVIEAVYDEGVRQAPVCGYFKRRHASVTRLDVVRSPDDGLKIVAAAHGYIGEEYSRRLAYQLVKEHFGIGRGRDEIATANEFICSTVYEQAVAEAFETGLVLEPGIRGITVPAALARSPFLTPVTVGWRDLTPPATPSPPRETVQVRPKVVPFPSSK